MKSALGVVLIGHDQAPGQQVLNGQTLVERAQQVLASVGLPVVSVRTLDELTDVDDVLVVHDPLQVMVTASMVRSVLDVVGGAVPAAVAVGQVTDTVKEVDDAGAIIKDLDRDTIRAIVGPLALWVDSIPVLPDAGRIEDIVAGLGQVIHVSVPGPWIRVENQQALRLAQAMLRPGT